MSPSIVDPDLYTMVSDGELREIIGIYFDENLIAGTPLFEKLTSESLKRFDSKPRVYDAFEFFGSRISTTSLGEFERSQQRYAKRLIFLEEYCE